MSENPTNNLSIAVLGGGSWATALVKIFLENTEVVHWYIRNQESIDYLLEHGHNPKYLSGVQFDNRKLDLTADINRATEQADIIILAIPSAFLESELDKLKRPLQDKWVFSAIKGIVPQSGLIVGEHLHEHYGLPMDQIGVITGPCHAEEVALERLSFLTIASTDKEKASYLASQMKSHFLKTKLSDDIVGTEYAAMLKNIYAIAAGMGHGLGYGDNYQSVLMSNAIREMKRFIALVHKMKRNINHTAYLGDLLVTGYSLFSRNRMFGNMIGKGYTVKSAMMEMNMVAEGYYAVKSAYKMIKDKDKEPKKDFPIINSVYQVLYDHKNPKKVFRKLSDLLD